MKTIILILIMAFGVNAQWVAQAYSLNMETKLETYREYTSHSNQTLTVWVRLSQLKNERWRVAGRMLTTMDCSDDTYVYTRVLDGGGSVIPVKKPKWEQAYPRELIFIALRSLCEDDARTN